MIKTKKILLVAAAFIFSASLFAQTVVFKNKVSSDVVEIVTDDDGTSCDFAGLKNRTTASLTSKRLDLGLDMHFWAYTDADKVGNSSYPYFCIGQKDNLTSHGWAVDDYWVEFRPINILGIGFHKADFIPGSYLPVAEKNIAAGNFGSDLGVFVRPVANLTIGAGLDFVSVFGGYKDAHRNPLLNAGFEYTIPDTVGFGISFRDFINGSRSIGVYAALLFIDNLQINLGFTYNGSFVDIHGNLLSAGIMFEKGAFGLNVDLVADIEDNKYDGYDLYSGADISYKFSKPMTLGLLAYFEIDFNHNEKNYAGEPTVIGINPYVTYAVNSHHELGAGVNIEFPDNLTVTLPVYWKYTF